ncbi:hypothetical protein GCM10023145_05060 [Angustibacter luteus]
MAALTGPELANAVDLVVWCEGEGSDRTALVANHRGRVRLHADGRHEVLRGADPVANEDPMAFLPYERELADPSPPNERNAYPFAYRRLVSLFADPDRSPDLAVVHTPRHWFVDEGGHPGEHGSLDVIQSRAPLVVSGAGVERQGYLDEHAWLVDVGPTLAAAAGVPLADLLDAHGHGLDGAALTHLVRPGRRKVIGILWDGAHCGDLLHLAESGELPGVARLISRGTALRGGALAHFPSITLTNHTSILTGVGPGRHGVLGNVFFDRATGEQVVPNDATTWHRSGEWLRPGVRTVFEMVHDNVPARIDGSPRTASVDEAIDRGADYSTMGVIRASGSSMGSGDLDSLLPDPFASRFVGELEHLKDGTFHWGSQVDDLGLQQVLQLWDSPAAAPDLLWWANVVTDAGHHAGGPRSAIARDALRDSDSRLVAFLDHLDGLGMLDDVTIALTADHGFEGADPSCTGSWRSALDGLGVPYRDEGPGFVYLDPSRRT